MNDVSHNFNKNNQLTRIRLPLSGFVFSLNKKINKNGNWFVIVSLIENISTVSALAII